MHCLNSFDVLDLYHETQIMSRMTGTQGQNMQYTSYLEKDEYRLQMIMNQYWDEGRWELEDLGEKGLLMLYALTDNKEKFEELLNKIRDDRIDSDE